MTKVAIISPSGKFYGSEQTLNEFLKKTSYKFDVYIKKEPNGFLSRLIGKSKHNIYGYSNPFLLYLKLIYKLTFKYDSVYINEAAHIRYIKLIARIFRKKNFIVHVRLTEDTVRDRIQGISSNVKLICVSSFIQQLVKASISKNTEILSSPFRAENKRANWQNNLKSKEKLNIGIIGRVTTSKGIQHCISFIKYLEENNQSFVLHFFGDVDQSDDTVKMLMQLRKEIKVVELKFHGFVNDKKIMFEKSDIIVHFNEQEPLGVIFFEALNNKVPFLGFKGGGIGEIAENLKLDNFIRKEKGWEQEMLTQIKSIDIEKYEEAYKNMLKQYSPKSYTKKLERVLIDQKAIRSND
ncbi:glycosyltransferase [Balneola sp. MJW-20]|uniref:glycosyltransferase n=1 Tax=Gracilimonas aurantiaca TaxID=3234185 RepID=UPI003467751C